MPSGRQPRDIAVCIGCGYDELHACVREVSLDEIIESDGLGGFLVVPAGEVATMQACHWLRVDYVAGLGGCSACPGLVECWDAGDRGVKR